MVGQNKEMTSPRQSSKYMEEGDAIGRLEHLNGVLQEKLFMKEGDIV